MEYNNKTIIICGLILVAIISLVYRYDQLALTIASGLVGYLSKDAKITLNPISEDEENDSP